MSLPLGSNYAYQRVQGENDNEKIMCVLFHFFKSIHQIQANEELLRLSTQKKVDNKNKRLSHDQSNDTKSENNRKLSDKLIEDLIGQLKEHSSSNNQAITAQSIVASQNEIISDHWKGKTKERSNFSSITSFFEYQFMCLFRRISATFGKASPNKVLAQRELEDLKVKNVGADYENVRLNGLFAQKPKPVAANSVITAGLETNSNINDNNSDNHHPETQDKAPTSCTIM